MGTKIPPSYANIFMDKLEENKHLRHANQIYTHKEKSATTPELEIVVGDQSECKISTPPPKKDFFYLKMRLQLTLIVIDIDHVSCMPNIASIYGFYILDCHFWFTLTFIFFN